MEAYGMDQVFHTAETAVLAAIFYDALCKGVANAREADQFAVCGTIQIEWRSAPGPLNISDNMRHRVLLPEPIMVTNAHNNVTTRGKKVARRPVIDNISRHAVTDSRTDSRNTQAALS
jgi:hypothetical protein